MFARPQARDLVNTAGEAEREAFSRRWNVVEAFAVMVVLLAALWWLAYPVGVLGGAAWANTAGRAVAGLILVFIIVVSPWLHRDTPASRGMGSPRQLWSLLARLPLAKRLLFGGLLAALTVALAFVAYQNAPGTLRFLFGVPREATAQFQANLGGMVTASLASFALAGLWMTCIVRYDNFGSALLTAGRILAVLLPAILLGALVMNGPAAFAKPDPQRLLGNVFGYVFWGAFQQLIFCACFGTRLRKGIPPATDPRARARRRLLVAVLAGFFFGLIHINSWRLAGLTWLLGVFLSWVFMEDRNRNLLALGVVHGVLGTCAGWLFRRGNDVHVNMRVGPWAMRGDPDWTTIAITSLLIVAFCAVIIVVARGRDADSG